MQCPSGSRSLRPQGKEGWCGGWKEGWGRDGWCGEKFLGEDCEAVGDGEDLVTLRGESSHVVSHHAS